MKHRTPRLLGAFSVTSILVALAVAGPVSATAAPLQFSITNLQPGQVVTQGQVAAFHVVATNPSTNTSNISQLYLTERSGASVYGILPVGGDRAGCTTTGQLLCSFGALRPGQTIDFTVALTAPTGSGTWHVDFEFSSTGYVIGTNRSHGDLFIQTYDLTTPSTGDTVDTAGTYVWDTSHRSFHNGLSLGNTNKQSTSVTVFDTTFPASAADGSTLTFTCDLSVSCPATFFGQVSQVDVDNGLNHTIHVVMQLYKPGKNPSQVNGVYHQWTTGTGTVGDPFVTHEETITTVCDSASAPTTVPCFLATKLGGNNLQLDVWILHNGKLGGF